MTKEEIVKTEALEARYERYKSILKDLTDHERCVYAECIQKAGMHRICYCR